VNLKERFKGAMAVLGFVLAYATYPAFAYDASQSTGPGTHQGTEGTTSNRGTSTDSKSGKNEDSGSAVGARRPGSATSSEGGPASGSTRPDQGGREMKESGAGTTSGAGTSRK
jgi:hypothetical protein